MTGEPTPLPVTGQKSQSIAIKREDEEVANKRRLLHDGHGIGEDKRLMGLIKNITKLYLCEHPEDKFHELHNQISKDISLGQTQADKQLKISQRCDTELESIQKMIDEQNQLVIEAKAQLVKLHSDMEYVDRLKKINVYPDCQTSQRMIDEINLQKEKIILDSRKCREQLETIFNATRELRKVFEEENNSNGVVRMDGVEATGDMKREPPKNM